MLDISEPTVVIMQTGSVSNQIPRVLSYPPYGPREGRVGENPGNEVVLYVVSRLHVIKTFLVVKETPVDASTVHAMQFFSCHERPLIAGKYYYRGTKEITAYSPEFFVYCIVQPVPRTGHQISRIK